MWATVVGEWWSTSPWQSMGDPSCTPCQSLVACHNLRRLGGEALALQAKSSGSEPEKAQPSGLTSAPAARTAAPQQGMHSGRAGPRAQGSSPNQGRDCLKGKQAGGVGTEPQLAP